MSALTYLTYTQLKNRLRAFLQKPANLVLTLVLIAACGLMLYGGGQASVIGARSITEAYALVTLLYIAMFVLLVYSGLKKGASCFLLADVHMLFTAPVDPRQTLMYGLIKQMGTSLLTGFFIIFQYGWMHTAYGVGVGFMLAVLAGYGLTLFAAQLTALTLYSLTAENPRARALCVRALVALCVLAAVYAGAMAARGQPDWLAALCDAATRWVSLFPVAGWLSAAVRGLREHQPLLWALGFGGYLAFSAGMILLLRRSRGNYFEDVLSATETAYAQREASKEGKAPDMMPEHVKTGKTGLGAGRGASAIYRKHCIESRRARRLLFEPLTMIFMAVTLAFGFFVREGGVWPVLAFATYMQLFSAGNARWTKELQRPYLYLLPDSPLRKLLWCMAESIRDTLLEAIVTGGLLGLILQLAPSEILALVLARFAIGLLLMAGNLLLERLFSGVRAKGLILLLYFAVMLLMLAPCVALAILSRAWLGPILTLDTTSLLAAAVAATLIALLVAYLCRNLLRYAETK